MAACSTDGSRSGYHRRTGQDQRVCIISTGSQGEPRSALARMANGDHPVVKVGQGDTIIISGGTIPTWAGGLLIAAGGAWSFTARRSRHEVAA